VNADGSLRRLLRESIRNPNEFAGIVQARNLALSLGERFADIQFPDPRPRIELHRILMPRRLAGHQADLIFERDKVRP